MDVSNFINSVATGNAIEAKESLNDLHSARAFEALDGKKTELAQSLFTGKEVEVQDTEETETEAE
jgi:thymidine phosphorylase